MSAFTPKDRAKDMVIFDPADYDRPMGMNMLEVSINWSRYACYRERSCRSWCNNDDLFIKIFDEEIFGPRIQHYFRNGALTLMDDEEDGGTLIDIPASSWMMRLWNTKSVK